MTRKDVAKCPSCGWSGHDTECITKHFGGYCGDGPSDNYGWEEWDDLVCPKCETAVDIDWTPFDVTAELVDILVEHIGPTDEELYIISDEGWDGYNERIMGIANEIIKLLQT